MSSLADLHQAVQNGDLDTVIRLAKAGADINAVYGRETAFTEAVESNRQVIAARLLNLPEFDPNAGNRFQRTPLFCAAQNGFYELTETLLDNGSDVNARDISGVSPLLGTAWYNHHQVAQLLISRGADVDAQDTSGETPLFRACANVSTDVVSVLLNNGADVDKRTFLNHSNPMFTPLMASVPTKYQLEVQHRRLSDMIKILELMLNQNMDLNAVQMDNRTALHVAVDRNELHATCLLVEAGCDLDLRDKDGLTAFDLAIQPNRPRYEMALFLLLYGADVNTRVFDEASGKNILPLTAVMKTRPETALIQKQRVRLLEALIPATDLSGEGAIELLKTMLNNTPVLEDDVEILGRHTVNQPSSLQRCCARTIRNRVGKHVLKKTEQLPMGWQAKKVISLGYDFRRFHPLQMCAIHTAVVDNDTENLRAILKNGCDVNSPLLGKIPLTLAASNGSVESVQVLMEYGADPALLDEEGQSALHAAAYTGADDVLKILLQTQCVPNSLNESGNTAIQEAANMGHFETVILLAKQGGFSSMIGSSGIPIIHLAAGSGHARAVGCLLEKSDDVKLLDKFGNTPLHVAASRGIQYLKNGIRLPALYTHELLEIMDAARLPMTTGGPKYVRSDGVDHLTVVELLLEKGVNIDITNSDKQVAGDIARQYLPEAISVFNSYL